MFDPAFKARLAVYCAATGADPFDAMSRVLEIGMTTWEQDPHYMPERVCGKVRTTIRRTPANCA
jgi:hypothetical protein